MAKKVNRKKQFKKQLADLKRAGQALAGVAAQKAYDVADKVMEETGKAVEAVTERVQETVEKATKKAEATKKEVAKVEKTTKKTAQAFESFAAELEGVAVARLETFYEAGIKSAKDFAKFTEKELLALKGIGPATIKQLKELGVKLKG